MPGTNKRFSLTVEAPRFVGYVDCFLHTPLYFRVENRGAEHAAVKLVAESGEGLIARFRAQAEVPFESAVKITGSDLFSPLYLTGSGEPHPAHITARLYCGEREVCRETACVTVLPYAFWEGLGGDAARLAAFVRPRNAACAAFLTKIRKTEKTEGWGAKNGDTYAEKTAVRTFFGALFSAMKGRGCTAAPEADLTRPVSADGAAFAENSRPVSALEAAVFACSCLEAMGMHPVLAVGERRVAVGVWLYGAKFYAGVTDDCGVVEQYVAEDDLMFFEAEDVFRGTDLAASGKKFLRALKAGGYRVFADIARCRTEGIAPAEGTVPAEGTAPAETEKREEAELSVFRGRAWERRLLDFSARNPLLNFSPKNTLRVACSDADALIAALGSEMRLVAGGGEGCAAPEAELDRLEWERGELRISAEADETAEKAGRLMRAGREAEEQSGAQVLYLAFGLLHGTASGKKVSAPVALLPVGLTRASDKTYFLHAEGAFFLNLTLFEFLGCKTEHGAPLGEASFSTVAGAMRAVRAAAEGMNIADEVYLGVFAFRNCYLWHDLRRNFTEFCKNENVRALLCGKAERKPLPPPPRLPLALPLEADGSQEEAVAFADTGVSFVLHGPPGTGKSQTIANLIARALGQGKRVLFIAEKKAALDVVMRRLEKIGIGDFCLQLNAEHADLAAVACKIEQTLSIFAQTPQETASAERSYLALLEQAEEARRALQKRGRAGFSAAEAIARSLACGEEELPGGSDAFYASLTEEKFALCRHMLAGAADAARACEGLRGAPFEDVELCGWSEGLQDRVVCACEALRAAGRHLTACLSLFAAFYRQAVPLLTESRLNALIALARRLLGGTDAACFEGVTAEECIAFYRKNRALDRLLAGYMVRFRTLAEPADREALARFCEEGGDWRLYPGLNETAKRLGRAAYGGLDREEIPKSLKLLYETDAALRSVAADPLSARFCGKNGIVPARRAAFLGNWYALSEQAKDAFGAFVEEAFFAACVRAADGAARPILEAFCGAGQGFLTAFGRFAEATGADRGKLAGEDLPAYAAQKTTAILENIDLLRSRCRFLETARRLEAEGAGNAARTPVGDLAAAFEKGAYRRFLEARAADPALAGETSETSETRAEALARAGEADREQTRRALRDFLIRRLPAEGEFSAQRAALARPARGNVRGAGLRGLLAEIPDLLSRACPCLLMSPSTAAQILQPEANAYDLVIFDEASQVSTAEAVGCIARAAAAIVVGDGNQLPPTPFFRASRPEEEEDDGESVLDDFLAAGMPERRLVWHYRSRHESLIAFSNAAYYHNALRTVPPPDAATSRVKLVRVDGVYDRGGSKCNRAEAEALTEEIARRLSNSAEAGKSMGVVTFSVAQKEEIEHLLAEKLSARGLERAAYAREEPLFVKNLENVQGDERDVILFSVCYGADAEGRLSLNFGPLNRAGGWRRLNVAASRAREEMLVYSSIPSAAIAAGRTSSRGVLGLKSFLEYAETGKTLCVSGDPGGAEEGISSHLAHALTRLGYTCRQGVGASSFKVDVAVRDPHDRTRYVLAVLLGGADGSVKDFLLKKKLLAEAGWKVLTVSPLGYYANPRREIGRIERVLCEITGKRAKGEARYATPYRAVAATARRPASFLTDAGCEEEICARLRAIVAREQPISRAFLKKRCLGSFGITARGEKTSARLDRLIDACGFRRDRVYGVDYFYKDPRKLAFSRYRTEGKTRLRREAEDYTVYEVVSMVKGALEENAALYADELAALFEREFRAERAEGELAAFLLRCVRYGEEKGIFRRSATDAILLA